MKSFKAPKKSLGTLDADIVARLIAAASDVALVVDRKGVIRDVAVGNAELATEIDQAWVGRLWRDTVTIESRPKIEALLGDAIAHAQPRWRQVNHPSKRGPDLPIVYSALQVDDQGRIVAVGRDLRAVAALQQRLMDAEQSIERDYGRLRHAEMRYRLLFQIASEAVLIVDASTQKVIEANPAAAMLLGGSSRKIIGRVFPDGFDTASAQAIQMLLATLRTAGRADEVRVRLADGKLEFLATASMFRQDDGASFLVRFTPVNAEDRAASRSDAKARVAQVLESSPDGLVVTNAEGAVVSANRAFLDLAELASEEQARGESLDRWLGRPGVDLKVLIANLRQHGSVRLFATTMRGEFGSMAYAEISAVAVPHADGTWFGFTVRNVGRRTDAQPARGIGDLPRSAEQLTELIGRVSLKDIVRETTDVIERLCIEAALKLTGDNRASAAEMLGLSRQSLYMKLRRYGLGDLDSENEAEEEVH